MPKSDLAEPRLSAVAFEQRCKTLAIPFSEALGIATGEITFAPNTTSTTAAMSLVGRATEMIGRNRGGTHRVVQLAPVGDDVFIWTGYRERWQKRGSEQNFRFVEAGFTLHVGRQGELAKPQILRSEWVGRRSTAFIAEAGHPHWQLDVLESARGDVPEGIVSFEDPSDADVVLEFGSAPAEVTETNLLLGLTIERLHLASAALWWRPGAAFMAHVPETVPELDRWVMGSLAYMRQEFGRCSIVTVAA